MEESNKVQRPAAALKFDMLKFIKNFNHYSPKNRIDGLNVIADSVTEETILKPSPIWDPHYPIIIRVGGIIIIIFGPTPKPKNGPCFTDILKEAINDKDTKFNRFSNSGVQHLIMDSPKNRVEIIANPVILKNVSSK